VQKQIIHAERPTDRLDGGAWLDLTSLASVELTSEDKEETIENALSINGATGWKAAEPGKQIIRLLFKKAQHIQRIRLEFVEDNDERNQEFALHYVQQADPVVREIRRQQWTFSPQGSVSEVEDYAVNLSSVVVLQLTIDPDRGKDQALATLRRWSVA
jgi:hypothetical protein